MTRHLSPFRVTNTTLIVSALLLAVSMWQSSGTTSAQGAGPITVVVLSDHFTAAQQVDFEVAVENFFQYSLLADADYAPYAHGIRVVPVYKPWAQSGSTQPDYGFALGGNNSNCDVSWSAHTTRALEQEAGPHNPTHIVIIANHGYDIGCTVGGWTYVTAGAAYSGVLEHEFGHLVPKLFDEYAAPDRLNTPYNGPPIDCRNCSNAMPPYWHGVGLGGAKDLPGCLLYGKNIAHAHRGCRMAVPDNRFCEVCRNELPNGFNYYLKPEQWTPPVGYCPAPSAARPAPAPPTNLRMSGAGLLVQDKPSPSVRVLLSFDATKRISSVQQVVNATGPYRPEQRLVGDLVYEVSDKTGVVSVGVIPADHFVARSYGGSQRHGATATESASFVIVVPNTTTKDLSTGDRGVQIVFYQLSAKVTAPLITPEVLQRLKSEKQAQEVNRIPAETLRKLTAAAQQ